MGTQKNHLNETALLTTSKHMFKLMAKKLFSNCFSTVAVGFIKQVFNCFKDKLWDPSLIPRPCPKVDCYTVWQIQDHKYCCARLSSKSSQIVLLPWTITTDLPIHFNMYFGCSLYCHGVCNVPVSCKANVASHWPDSRIILAPSQQNLSSGFPT